MIRVNKGFQVCRAILDSKAIRVARVCLGSRVRGESKDLWARLETKDPLGFLGPLDQRGSLETLAPQGRMALKV